MAGGGGGAASSRGRGKFRKFTRGGGKHFSKNLRPLDADGNEVGMWGDAPPKDEEEDSEEDSSEEESEEESGDEIAVGSSAAATAELSREERKNQKKAQKAAAIKKKNTVVEVGDLPPSDSESEDDMPVNPNHSKAARNQTKKPTSVEEVTEGVKKVAVSAPASRREREALAAQEAKARYQKLHEEGKTDQAKADLARLKLIREKREQEAARKQAEKEEAEEQAKIKRAEIEAKEAKKREAALGPSKNKKK
ncbi:casein kinase substrate phosphoprotein PP28-domain-containing protein [Podospora fimiseda]|uniref:Casein kinase substrate phosphoprotein PP28-domain-containing protein n=1 Tax=Podospora fimiseda TaxID=252190 RepID=A0AAN7H8D4_9PEZI|nr:casein kinase substrate phosphoprotein PP28-domain-containing protein [Podospora fimiseda]